MKHEPLSLTDHLLAIVDLWCEAHDAKAARLGRLVVNDTAFFTRLAERSTSPRAATLEKFADFLGSAEAWPEGTDGAYDIPGFVLEFVHRVHGSRAGAALSPRNSGADTPLELPRFGEARA